MSSDLPIRQTIVWLLLIAITIASWAAVQDFFGLNQTKFIASILLVLAFVKTRFILLDFMELRHAPLPARLFVETWGIGVCAILLALFWMN